MLKVPQPLISRSLAGDLSMTADEKIERMANILAGVEQDASPLEKGESLKLIADNRHKITDLNMRTLIKVIRIRRAHASGDWSELARYSVIL
jgi:hypothetical protein